MTNVAISLCPNDIFVFSALLLRAVPHPFNISVFPIGILNQKLALQCFDFIKVSSMALIRSPDYRLARVGASLAVERGPQLVRKADTLPKGFLVGVPSRQSTGAELIRRYFPELMQKEFPLHRLSALVAEGAISYGLIINEDINRLEQLGLESLCDLGLRWNAEFKACLPLGLIGAHRRLSDEKIRAFESVVHKSVLWARANTSRALELAGHYTGMDHINMAHIQAFTKNAHVNPELPLYVKRLRAFVSSSEGEKGGG